MEEKEKIIYNERELMRVLTMFFAVFWSGEKKFSQIVVRSRENSLQAQTRISIDFRDNKELWNLVIQDYIKSTASEEEKKAFVREQIRLLLGGTQKKRYEKLLEKMPEVGLEIEEDIVGVSRKYFAFEIRVEKSTRRIESQYQLLERDGKFLGRASLPSAPAAVVDVLETVVKNMQNGNELGLALMEFVYLPSLPNQEGRVVVLGLDYLPEDWQTFEEKIQDLAQAKASAGKLLKQDQVAGVDQVVAYLLDLDTPVRSDSAVPFFLKDLQYTPDAGRGVVVSSQAVSSLVPENALLYLASGENEQKAQDSLVLLYEQVLSMFRDLKAREKLQALKNSNS